MKSKIPAKPIKILGEPIDPDNCPILYGKAKTNKIEFEKQLRSIADTWHEGSIRSAIIALESDLGHG